MRARVGLVLFVVLWSSLVAHAQVKHVVPVIIEDTTVFVPENANNELDFIDLLSSIGKGHIVKRVDTGTKVFTKPHISAVPAAGYTLLTGFAGLVAANVAFYANHDSDAKVSSVQAVITYTAHRQIILPVQANIWTKSNKYNIVVDWRYLKYPSLTYGLGTLTKLSDGYHIDYSLLRFRQRVFRQVARNVYLGLGYDLEYLYDIREIDPPLAKRTFFENYGFNKTEYASGITFNFLYDSRKNSINASGGEYLNIIYTPHPTQLGNENSWRSILVDARKYIHLGGNNVLAFWNYDWITFDGNAPYLLLPFTGGDAYANTGRGYIQGRFRGRKMIYLESEYRFGITRNGLIGGVVFANAQSLTEENTDKFVAVAPAYGLGVRLKLNKFSKTNIALDYGIGTGGSHGFFVCLGEAF